MDYLKKVEQQHTDIEHACLVQKKKTELSLLLQTGYIDLMTHAFMLIFR